MKLEEFRANALVTASGHRLYAQELDDAEPRIVGHNRLFPFKLCWCVWDSPENPCLCPDAIWWIPEKSILQRGHAKHRDHDGESLEYLDISLDADIIVEASSAVSVRRLHELGDDLVKIAGALGGGTMGVVYAATIPWKDILKWLGLAILDAVISGSIWEIIETYVLKKKN
jgi:hypothetical protein